MEKQEIFCHARFLSSNQLKVEFFSEYNSLHTNYFNDIKYEQNEMMYYVELIVKLVENGINELDFV